MTVVTKLSVQHIRSHDSFIATLSPGVTVITGKNGSGKTSLIEALYLALQGSSFKGVDSDMLRGGESWWRIDVAFEDDNKRTVSYDSERELSRKKFVVDDHVAYRLQPKHKYPVVLFEPDDLRLLQGSPTRRRQFIDRFISQLDPLYGVSLRKYERSLKQRNNLLKKLHKVTDELFVWNVALSEYGAYIIEKRIAFIEQINSKITAVYNDIAALNDEISVHYSHTFIGDIKQKLLTELDRASARDAMIGSTSVGPHRHDILFLFNNSPAQSSASRGEVRTIVLALKFLEVDIIEQIVGQRPLILLDDVFSELDASRQKALSDHVRAHQIIITTTHLLAGSKNTTHIKLKD